MWCARGLGVTRRSSVTRPATSLLFALSSSRASPYAFVIIQATSFDRSIGCSSCLCWRPAHLLLRHLSKKRASTVRGRCISATTRPHADAIDAFDPRAARRHWGGARCARQSPLRISLAEALARQAASLPARRMTEKMMRPPPPRRRRRPSSSSSGSSSNSGRRPAPLRRRCTRSRRGASASMPCSAT